MPRYFYLIALLIFLPASEGKAQNRINTDIDSLVKELHKLKEDSIKAMVVHEICFAYSKINIDLALVYAQQELEMSTRIGWKKGEARAYNNFGNCYNNKSDYPRALENYFKALSINESISNTLDIKKVLGNISLVYQSLEKYDKALEIQFKVLGMTKDTDKVSLEYIQGNIGMTYSLKGLYNEALKYQQKALLTAQEIKDYPVIISQMTNLARTYKSMKKYPISLAFSYHAMDMARMYGREKARASNLGIIGSDYLSIAKDSAEVEPEPFIPAGKAANLRQAILYLDSGITACREIGFVSAVMDDYGNLSEAYTLAGNYKAALEAWKKYTTVKDSIFSTENKLKITNLETKREIDLKDKQLQIDRLEVAKKRNERAFFIAGLLFMMLIIGIVFKNYNKQKNTNRLLIQEREKVNIRTEELNTSNRELKQTLDNLNAAQHQLIITEKQKENELIRSRIAMDIHDEVSSELTRISWMSELAKLKFKKADLSEATILLDKITATSRRTIGNLKEIIWTVKPDNDTIDTLIAYLRNYIAVFLKEADINHTIDLPDQLPPVPINPEIKRNLFLVLKDALDNAVTHSRATKIDVVFVLNDDNTYKLSIKDNGSGFDTVEVHDSAPGLKNMLRRMQEINAVCTINTVQGKGTSMVFEGILF